MIDPNTISSKTYAHLAQQAGILAHEVIPRASDQQYKDTRNLVVTYLRMAASKLRQLAESQAKKEKG